MIETNQTYPFGLHLGTVHGDDFTYWTCIEGPQNKETRQMIETFTKLITTFARTG